jgi:hypothetical protein
MFKDKYHAHARHGLLRLFNKVKNFPESISLLLFNICINVKGNC